MSRLRIRDALLSLEVHVLASGSDGNCVVVKADDTAIMIDAGLSGRKITALMSKAGLEPKRIDAILLTHEHSDHVQGAGVLSRKHDIPIHANRYTYMHSKLGNVSGKEIFQTLKPFSIGPVTVRPLPTSHDAVEPNAFAFQFNGTRMLLATDTGKVTDPVMEELSLVDLAIIESNYDNELLVNGDYPVFLKRLIRSDNGHLSNVDCAAALKRTEREGRKVFLAHLSKNNNTPEIAKETVSSGTGCKLCELDCLECQGDVRCITL